MAIFDELKSVGKVLQEAGKIEQYQQILDAQRQLLEMQKRIEDLESDKKQLQDELTVKGQITPEGNLYWLDHDGKKDGPFCTRCWDDEHKLIRLHQSPVSGRMNCPKCSTEAKGGIAHVFRHIDHRRNSAM